MNYNSIDLEFNRNIRKLNQMREVYLIDTNGDIESTGLFINHDFINNNSIVYELKELINDTDKNIVLYDDNNKSYDIMSYVKQYNIFAKINTVYKELNHEE